ncbi:MAG TPA: erythromycin esterase family protein [Longimicrobium sp.]|nr:erythromycin esterase family protein [Longimicrobium sp.]
MTLLRSSGAAALALCAILTACGDGGGPPVGPGPPANLPAGVYALDGIAETLPYTDLEPFSRIVGNTRFVALGESTHASAGYYRAKVRLIRYMVETMGFRVLAFESPWMEAFPAARYVASCTGTPDDALDGLFRVWRDANVRELLRWLCEYNRAHPADPVTFFGFDIQEPWKSAPALHQFVRQAAPPEAARSAPLDRCLGATHGSDQFYLSQEYRDHVAGRRNTAAHQDCLGGITEMESWIGANAAALQAATSAAAVEEARLALVALRAYEEQLWVPDPGGYQARDYGMAQLLLRLHALHAPGKKTIVWAWNWHIARRYEEVRGWNDDPDAVVPRQGARAMGGFLTDALGADYLPVALIGYRVYQALPNGPPVAASPRAVELRLHGLGRDYLLVDLRQPIPGDLLPPGTTYQVSQEWGDPYRQFGALLFLEQSPAATFVR